MAFCKSHLICLLCEEDTDPEEAGEEYKDAKAREGLLLREFGKDGGAAVEESPRPGGQNGGFSS